MNKAICYSMQDRLAPREQVIFRLKERMEAGEQAVRIRRPVTWYAAAAVCLMLAVAAVPVYRAVRPAPQRLHSYVTEGGPGWAMTVDAAGVGSTEMPQTPVDGGETGEAEAGESFGGAYIGTGEAVDVDAAAQEDAIAAYTGLMTYFLTEYGFDSYPDWYGGAYVLGSELIVCVAEEHVPEAYQKDVGGDKVPDKEFFLQIQEWAGNGRRTDAVGFCEVKYSLNFLRDLQDRVTALPEMQNIGSWGCGVEEMGNRIELTVERADEALLKALAELDPDDDAISVTTGSAVFAAEE